jgi:hypothetical protein
MDSTLAVYVKMVNEIEDFLEYRYHSCGKDEMQIIIMNYIDKGVEKLKENRVDWYGYWHVDGTLHVKRFFDVGDVVEAENSPFVEEVIGPFLATDAESARLHIMESNI